MTKSVLAALFLSAGFPSFTASAQPRPAPTTEQYMNVMTVCGLGSRLAIDNSTRDKVRLMVQDGLGQGKVVQEITPGIGSLIVGTQQSPLYDQFVRCMQSMLSS